LNNFKPLWKSYYYLKAEYQDILERLQKRHLVYLDPPYHETFTDYNSNKFREDEQCELKLIQINSIEKV
jgi:site-specific DNA-adenine methylase